MTPVKVSVQKLLPVGSAGEQKGGRGKTSDHGQGFDDHQKINFRLLARALANECQTYIFNGHRDWFCDSKVLRK